MTDRDPTSGKFVPGNRASPGRAKRNTERQYLALMRDAVTEADWIAITKKAVTDARAGNSWARSWLSDYLIGKPPQILELRGMEAQQLAELLELYKVRGLSPSAVFDAMLAEIAQDG